MFLLLLNKMTSIFSNKTVLLAICNLNKLKITSYTFSNVLHMPNYLKKNSWKDECKKMLTFLENFSLRFYFYCFNARRSVGESSSLHRTILRSALQLHCLMITRLKPCHFQIVRLMKWICDIFLSLNFNRHMCLFKMDTIYVFNCRYKILRL